ncbi:CBO0543 family protein [Halalkalibacter urbisdiaboli]|uniref:CBO0543 family protein n=1 Tax=Halalkalibacter urbisdiaboli TaxID=1960589 RepID=UPI000B445C61|nr:CBO0543 family protein [Halalkalibacter urbisdiaboli]
MSQQEHFKHLQSLKSEIDRSYMDYWHKFSDFSSWQFWVILGMLFIPLIILYLRIDRKNIFLLGFFGFSIHMLTAYTDALGMRKLWWDYPYTAIPQLPEGISLDASLIPVYFILLYQWCLKRGKNYWLYGTLSAFGFTFILKPIMVWLHLFELDISWFGLLLAYLFVIYSGKIITNIFIKMSGINHIK